MSLSQQPSCRSHQRSAQCSRSGSFSSGVLKYSRYNAAKNSCLTSFLGLVMTKRDLASDSTDLYPRGASLETPSHVIHCHCTISVQWNVFDSLLRRLLEIIPPLPSSIQPFRYQRLLTPREARPAKRDNSNIHPNSRYESSGRGLDPSKGLSSVLALSTPGSMRSKEYKFRDIQNSRVLIWSSEFSIVADG